MALAVTSDNEAAIRADRVSWRYRGASRPALDQVSLTVRAGSCFGLLGPNGAGKSTLFGLMAGMRRPQAGDIEVAGVSVRRSPGRVRGRIGLAPQDFAFYPRLTGRENMRFFSGAYRLEMREGRRREEEAAHTCDLAAVLDQPAESYSGGLKRRLNLALALLNRPQILLLDEPTVGIDARSRRTILDAVAAFKQAGTTIVYTSHYLEEVEALCDDIAVIDKGRVVFSGSLPDLRRAQAGRMTIRLSAALDRERADRLRRLGALMRGEREIEAEARSPQAVAALFEALAGMGLDVAGARISELSLERLYLDLIETAPGAAGAP
jgi:ABC-2 type transport system ATP-binding protein